MASTLRFDNWEDSNGTPILDGANLSLPSSALPSGSILQVVSTHTTTPTSTTSSDYTDTANTLTITPTSASNKILIFSFVGTIYSERNTESNLIMGRPILHRNGILIAELDTSFRASVNTSQSNIVNGGSMSLLDDPQTTSPVTYKIRVRADGGRIFTVADTQSMIAMEVVG